MIDQIGTTDARPGGFYWVVLEAEPVGDRLLSDTSLATPTLATGNGCRHQRPPEFKSRLSPVA